MNKLLFKQICILSSIFGAFLGILSLIPVIRNISAIIVTFLLAPIIIIYLKKTDILKALSIQDGMVLGAIAGIVSIIVFVLTLTPLVLILSLFIKNGYISWIASLIKNAGLFIYLMLLSFMCILNAITNAFSGLATIYIYDFLKAMKEQ
jgi:hypothetical protein